MNDRALTAGGLDGAMRLSTLAADVAFAYLDTGDASVLAQYAGDRFRARFLTRRWMRRAIDLASTPLLAELAFTLLRVPPLRGLAEHVFFARGSFPDAELRNADYKPRPSVSTKSSSSFSIS